MQRTRRLLVGSLSEHRIRKSEQDKRNPGSLPKIQPALWAAPARSCFSGHWLFEKKCSPREMVTDWLYQSPVSEKHGGAGKLRAQKHQ